MGIFGDPCQGKASDGSNAKVRARIVHVLQRIGVELAVHHNASKVAKGGLSNRDIHHGERGRRAWLVISETGARSVVL